MYDELPKTSKMPNSVFLFLCAFPTELSTPLISSAEETLGSEHQGFRSVLGTWASASSTSQ